MAQFLDVAAGPLAAPAWLQPPERATLARAPRRPWRETLVPHRSEAADCPAEAGGAPAGPGTVVTVQAYPVPLLGRHADHMFVTLDDGRDVLIARGGPSASGPGELVRDGLADQLTVRAEVKPQAQSLDQGRTGRVIFRGFVPQESAAEAADAARRHAAGVNRGGNDYRRDSSSNSFAADVVEDLFGCRVGDARTWGSRTRLRDTRVDRSPPPAGLPRLD